MTKLGFPYRFTRWIMTCVKIVSYSIIVNGETTQPFPAAKGLRQGDPISPFLFSIAIEYLSRTLNELQNVPLFKYHPQCAKLKITHLCFADDLLLFSKRIYNLSRTFRTIFSNSP